MAYSPIDVLRFPIRMWSTDLTRRFTVLHSIYRIVVFLLQFLQIRRSLSDDDLYLSISLYFNGDLRLMSAYNDDAYTMTLRTDDTDYYACTFLFGTAFVTSLLTSFKNMNGSRIDTPKSIHQHEYFGRDLFVWLAPRIEFLYRKRIYIQKYSL